MLIVEDDDDVRASLVELLQHEGYAVVTARDGREGLAILDGSPRPFVAVVDLMMPLMTGWEFVNNVKARDDFADIPLIVTSAVAARAPAGADHVVRKPLDLDRLLELIRSYCETERPPTDEVNDERIRTLARLSVEMAERQRSSADVAAMIVHDLRSPLSVIETNLDYVLSDDEDTAEKKAALEDVRDAARRMNRLISNLLDVARLEANALEPRKTATQIEGFVSQIVRRRQPMARAHRLTLASTLHWRGAVPIDAEQLQRVVDNILDNAFRYTPAGGRIELTVSRASDSVRLAIGNSGPPVPEPLLDLIFERFVRDQHARTANAGLGLYFCRRAIEAHGGAIEVKSTPELPTVFVIDLPA